MTPRAARGDRAVERARRGAWRADHRALRRLLARAAAGPGRRADASRATSVTCNGVPVPLQRDRDAGHLRRRRALPGLAAAVGAAPDDRRPRPARVRRHRPLERPLASAAAPTTSSTRAAGLRPRSRSTPTRPRPGERSRFESDRAHRRATRVAIADARRERRIPSHARPAASRRRRLTDRRPPTSRTTTDDDDHRPRPAPPATGRSPGCYDEMVDATARPRASTGPTWRSAFAELGVEELLRRQEEAARLLDQDGVIYNAYGDGRPTPRPALAARPGADACSRSREWETIETGVIERAELLNLVLDDLYGQRDLLRRRPAPARARVRPRRLPARRATGSACPAPQQLFSYAADLGRDADGRLARARPTAPRRRRGPATRWRTAR